MVGGGIIGTGIAYYLRDSDHRVTLVEKNQLGSGTSRYSTAMFGWHFPHPADYLFRRRSWAGWRDVLEQTDLEHHTVGNVRVARSQEALSELRETVAVQQSYGIETRMISPEEAAEYGIDPDAIEGAMHSPREGYVNQQGFMEFYAERAQEHGVEVLTGTEVHDVTTEDGAVTGVETEAGHIDADVVVNAAGPWSPRLNDMVEVSLPLKHSRAQIMVLQADAPHGFPFIDLEGDHYFRPESETKMLAGRHGPPFHQIGELDPDHAHDIQEEFRLSVIDQIETVVPGLQETEVINDWVGIRTVTPDGRPVLGPTSVEGFVVATGMSGSGVSQHAAVAKTLSQYFRTGEASDTLRYHAPSRFRGQSGTEAQLGPTGPTHPQ